MKIIQLFAFLLMVPTSGFAALTADAPANVFLAAQVIPEENVRAPIDRKLLKLDLKSTTRNFAFVSKADISYAPRPLDILGYYIDLNDKIFLITSKRKYSKKPVTKRSAWLKKRKAKRRKARVNRNSTSYRNKLRRAVVIGVYR